jgi:hypothetical protein
MAEESSGKAREVVLSELRGVEEVKVSLDWGEVLQRVEGLGSGRHGLSWNFATAKTRVNGKTLVLATVRHVKGMSKLKVVESLMGQVLSWGSRSSSWSSTPGSIAPKSFATSPSSTTSLQSKSGT